MRFFCVNILRLLAYILTELQHDKSYLLYTPILYIKYKAWFTLAIDNLHVRLIFYLGGKKVNSVKNLLKSVKLQNLVAKCGKIQEI